MQFHPAKTIIVLAVASLISACGGDGDPFAPSPTPPATSMPPDASAPPEASTPAPEKPTPPVASTVQYAGRVIDKDGNGVAEISVRLENRLSDQQIEVITAADGSFSVAVEKGVYDVLFDDKDATRYVSLMFAGIDLQTMDVTQYVPLQSAAELETNLLFGSATDTAGVPAAERTLLILPAAARAPAALGMAAQIPDPVFVQTDGQGRFSRTLAQAGMDLSFDILVLKPEAPQMNLAPLAAGYTFASEEDANAFQQDFQEYLNRWIEESVDIDKPDGALDVRLVLGSKVRNLRSALDIPSVVREDALKLAERESPAGTPPAVGTAGPAAPFTFEASYLFGNLLNEGFFSGGQIDVNGDACQYVNFRSLADLPSDTAWNENSANYQFLDTTSVCATKAGWLDFTFRRYKLMLKTTKAGSFNFTDAAHNTYAVRVDSAASGVHVLTYDSQQPAITSIHFDLQYDVAAPQ